MNRQKNNINIKKIKHWIPFYLIGLPGMLYLLINNYLPMFGLQIAFKKFNYKKGIWGSDWSGLDNFKYLFKTKDAWVITRNTIGYNLIGILLGAVLGIGAAVLLNEIVSKKVKKLYQTAILLPYLMSMVIVSYLVFGYLSGSTGLFNSMITKLGGEAINFYGEPKYWPFVLIFVNQWKGIGFGMILYLSTLISIDKSYYEAAQLDGASKWRQFKFITFPLLKPTIITLVILQVGNIFRSDFGLYFQVPMNQGALYSVTNTIDTYVYRGLLVRNDIGMSAAAGFYQSIVGFVCVLAVNEIIKRINRESSLF